MLNESTVSGAPRPDTAARKQKNNKIALNILGWLWVVWKSIKKKANVGNFLFTEISWEEGIRASVTENRIGDGNLGTCEIPNFANSKQYLIRAISFIENSYISAWNGEAYKLKNQFSILQKCVDLSIICIEFIA